jgi:condensin complex subunit 2
LNHLSIDSEGRIVFDSSDDTTDAKAYPNTTQMQQTLVDPTAMLAEDVSHPSLLPDNQPSDQDIDLTSLASKFFPDLSILDSQDICPSMKSFTLGDPSSDLNIPFLKVPDDWRESHRSTVTERPLVDIPMGDKSGIFLDSENAVGFDDDDDGPLGGFDIGPDVGFGEGGEAWAKDAVLEPMLRVARADDSDREGADGIVVGNFDPANPHSDTYAVGLNYHNGDGDPTDNILSYFDAALKSTKAASWAGPEHWRIRKIKAAQSACDNPPPARTKKEKEPFEIDFVAPMDQGLAEMLYTPAATNAAISLPKAQWKTKGRNLLPDDRHFDSRSLLGLWLKPKARVGRRRVVPGMPSRGVDVGATTGEAGEMEGHVDMNEAYWARRREEEEQERRRREDEREEEKERREGDYDANFFADDDGALPFGGGLPDDVDDDEDEDGGGVGFTDAREMLSPPPTATSDSQPTPGFDVDLASQQPAGESPALTTTNLLPGSFGAQLVTQGGRRLRPEYVNYARVAKKVDVRRLKENMWRGMSRALMSSLDGDDRSYRTEDDGSGVTAPTTTEPGGNDGDVEGASAAASPPRATKHGQVKGEGAGFGVGDGGGGGPPVKFTSLIRDLRTVYPEHQMRDISTSYCFICLLHLANEKGLLLEGDYDDRRRHPRQGEGERGNGNDDLGKGMATGMMTEISVRRDESVGLGYVGE